jgi:protein phosphatase
MTQGSDALNHRIRGQSSAIEVRCGAASHAGNVRSLNEDAICVSPPAFVVADGMGGHDGGEVASSLAIGALSAFPSSASVSRADLVSSIVAANSMIFEHSGRGERVMGTTITGIAFTDEPRPSLVVFNIGDSRTYLLASGNLTQVTLDHSYVQELVEAGQITVNEMRTHPERNVVTRALGVESEVEVDAATHEVVVGQRWLMCSDGLTGEVSDEEIQELLSVGSPQAAAELLIEATLAGHATDNVSVVVVDVVAIEELDDPDRTDPRPRGVRERVVIPGDEPRADLIDETPPLSVTGPANTPPSATLIDSVPDGLRRTPTEGAPDRE